MVAVPGVTPPPKPAVAAASAPAAARRLGRFELLKLLGKSTRTMAWLVHDPRSGQQLVLTIPRSQPPDTHAMEEWLQRARGAARLNHPHLAHVVEVGEQERWPYVANDRAQGETLAEKLDAQGVPPTEMARWMLQALDGLAFAHEAGFAHRDLQLHLLTLSEQGTLRLMGLEVAPPEAGRDAAAAGGSAMSVDPNVLRAQRQFAQRDVLAAGLLMHRLLANAPALDEADVGRVIERLPPLGNEFVRLPFSLPRPVAEPLRAIVNRSVDRQERQRYRTARTLSHALQGWLDADSQQGGGPLAQLLDRVRAIGALPAMPGGGLRAAELMRLERERTNELAELVLRDLALSFELLRAVNTAQVRGVQVAGNGPVLTVRRAIAMLGLDGVQRAAASLRPWPGPLQPEGAQDLQALFLRVKRAGRVAQALRPPGYDAEVVHLVTLLQSLGRLVLQYHLPDDAAQVRRLMQPAPPAKPGEREEPGMNEETACFAVLGTGIEHLGSAIARQWGLDDEVLHMIRRLPEGSPVHAPENDGDTLRVVASCANEAIDAIGLPAAQVGPALAKVLQRYARALKITLKDLQAALQGALHGDVDTWDEPVPEDGAETLAAPLPGGPR
jgi:non-specific serine/threonine protein kinase